MAGSTRPPEKTEAKSDAKPTPSTRPEPKTPEEFTRSIQSLAKNLNQQIAGLRTLGNAAPDNEYKDSVIAARLKEFAGTLDGNKESKDQFKSILDQLGKSAEGQFDKWKAGGGKPEEVQAEWKAMVDGAAKEVGGKFEQLIKTANEEKASAEKIQSLESMRDKAAADLNKFNDEVLNRQMDALVRSVGGQKYTKVTQEMSREAAGRLTQNKEWRLLDNAKGKVDSESEDKNVISAGHAAPKPIENGIYQSSTSKVKLNYQGGNLKAIAGNHSSKEAYSEMLDFMKFQCGQQRIVFDGKVSMEDMSILIKEAKKRNMSVRLGPEIMKYMTDGKAAVWDRGIIGSVLNQTIGRVWRLFGKEWDPRAQNVIDAVKDCEKNYIENVEQVSRKNAETKIVDKLIEDVKAEGKLKILDDKTPLKEGATPDEIGARLAELKEARAYLNDKLQLQIEQELEVNPGNGQLERLRQEYERLVGKLDEKLAEVGLQLPEQKMPDPSAPPAEPVEVKIEASISHEPGVAEKEVSVSRAEPGAVELADIGVKIDEKPEVPIDPKLLNIAKDFGLEKLSVAEMKTEATNLLEKIEAGRNKAKNELEEQLNKSESVFDLPKEKEKEPERRGPRM